MQRTILIVEDMTMNAMLVASVLKELDVRCIFAATGWEAVELYRKTLYVDLILMDLHLPGLNGLSATDEIRATELYAAHPIPIIAVTGNALMESKTEFLKTTGLADYITKPITREKIITAVLRHLPAAQAVAEQESSAQ